MKKSSLVFSVISAWLCSCVNTNPQPLRGAIYTDVVGPNQVLPLAQQGSKQGEACSSNVFGVVSWGDASIDTAKKNGGVTHVASVDYRNLGILSILYNKTCTIVSGT